MYRSWKYPINTKDPFPKISYTLSGIHPELGDFSQMVKKNAPKDYTECHSSFQDDFDIGHQSRATFVSVIAPRQPSYLFVTTLKHARNDGQSWSLTRRKRKRVVPPRSEVFSGDQNKCFFPLWGDDTTGLPEAGFPLCGSQKAASAHLL